MNYSENTNFKKIKILSNKIQIKYSDFYLHRFSCGWKSYRGHLSPTKFDNLCA